MAFLLYQSTNPYVCLHWLEYYGAFMGPNLAICLLVRLPGLLELSTHDIFIWSYCTHRTLPPQNWQSSPCHPSGQIQLAFVQMPPFIQELSLMHFPKTTLLQQNISIKSTNKTNKHFRWLCIECKISILNIWAKLFSIFDFATFSLVNVVVFELLAFGIRLHSKKKFSCFLLCVFSTSWLQLCSLLLYSAAVAAAAVCTRSHPKLSLLLTWTIY